MRSRTVRVRDWKLRWPENIHGQAHLAVILMCGNQSWSNVSSVSTRAGVVNASAGQVPAYQRAALEDPRN